MTRSIRSALVAIACLILATVASVATASANVQVGSSGWQWGNPQPEGNTLHDLAFAPGSTTGYGVGDFGTIVKTTDSGATWTGLPAGTFTNLTRVQSLPDGSVIAGGGCVMRISTDGGATFSRIPFAASEVGCPHGVVAFSYSSRSAGYNLLDDGEVQHTTDGGQSFLSNTTGLPGTAGSPTGGPAKPLDITFLADGMTGFASTTDGHIYRTADGAQTWSAVYAGAPITRITFPNGGPIGYAAGSGGTFLTTIDTGATWVPHDSGTTENLTDLSCSNSECAIATGRGDIVDTTLDGGLTFTQPHPPVEVNAVAFVSATQVLGVGNSGGTAISTDGGVSYTRVGQPLPSAYTRLRAGGANGSAYAAGPNGALAQTIDGGKTWTPAKVGGAGNIVDVSFPTPMHGWALDSSGALYTTSNGAASWKSIDTGSTAKPNAVYASSASHVMVVGPRGIRRSTNSGLDFTSDPKINLVPLSDVDTAGAGTVVVYGPQLILESRNDGESFTSVHKPGPYHRHGRLLVNRLPVYKVDFVSATTGFLLDGLGRLWSTRNTGRTWTELSATGTENAAGMAFSSAANGYLVINRFGSVTTNSGFLLRTSDGGRSWHPQFIVSDPINPRGVAAGGSTDYLLSNSSRLLSTTTGGDWGQSSKLTIKASRARLSKPSTIAVSGTLAPASGFEEVVVSSRPAGALYWTSHIAKVDSNGKFTSTWSNLRRGANQFVAQWQGDFRSAGAGTSVLNVTVAPKAKPKHAH